MNYFKTLGGSLILIAMIGLDVLFSTGVWYMIAVGLVVVLGSIGAGVMALVVAPTIGIMMLILFMYGQRLKQMIIEWEAENGKYYNEEHRVYYNKHSLTWMVTCMKVIVTIMDTGGIAFRILQTQAPWYGQALLFLVFEMLAVSPWFIGTLVHIVAHRPAYAIRREVAYVRDVVEAQNERRNLLESLKRPKEDYRPPTAPRHEIAPAQRQPALPEPRTDVHVSSPHTAPKPAQFAPFTPAPSETPSGNGANRN